jgi:DMSO/TMAO reductase YedYZ molybdopterin-dependent catalytic subunit
MLYPAGSNEVYRVRAEQTDRSRREFLHALATATAWRSLGLAVPYARFVPAGLMPVVATGAETADLLGDAGKRGLRLLLDRPLNVETPAHLLDDDVTPASRLFVRNNGVPPKPASDPQAWEVRIHGEACERPTTLTLGQLRQQFASVTLQLQLECGGNGRAEFRPRASGNQWTTGAIGCPRWTGVRLAEVLRYCGVADNAVYVAYRGADAHLSGDPGKDAISRGVPIEKALDPHTLLAFAMNDEEIPALHGAPLRLVAGGWPGSVSGKWVTEILVRDRVHDGAKMGGSSYRVPCSPVSPGTAVAAEDMCIIESMPVKSLITHPRSGLTTARARPLALRGHAWAGDDQVAAVHVSVDFGATWQATALKPPVNRLAWQRFHGEVTLEQPGYYEIWARATDDSGRAQPMLVPGWNPKGYLNNACHRIAVQVV